RRGCGVRGGPAPGAAGLAVGAARAARRGRVPDAVRPGGRRDTTGWWVRRTGTVAVRLGAVLHPRRVARPGADLRRPPPAATAHIGRAAGGPRRRDRRGRWRVRDGVRDRGGGRRPGVTRRRATTCRRAP